MIDNNYKYIRNGDDVYGIKKLQDKIDKLEEKNSELNQSVKELTLFD